MDVSIIIVTYNSFQITSNCIESVIEKTKNISFELIVVDNASTDGSKEYFSKDKRITYLYSDINLGFGRANNKALALAQGKYVLYLNSDTIIKNNAVKYFFDYFENAPNKASLGGIGANLLNTSGQKTYSSGTFYTYKDLYQSQANSLAFELKKTIKTILGINHVIFRTPTAKNSNEIFDKDNMTISGADLFIRNDSYAFFDERYFLYYEDTDLELKMHNAGKRFELIEGPYIIHLERGSQSQDVHRIIVPNCWLDYSSILYAKKNLATKAILLKLLIILRFLNPLAIKRTKPFIKRVLQA